jgi:hypothetical protein
MASLKKNSLYSLFLNYIYAVVSVYNTNYVYVAISFQHMSNNIDITVYGWSLETAHSAHKRSQLESAIDLSEVLVV